MESTARRNRIALAIQIAEFALEGLVGLSILSLAVAAVYVFGLAILGILP